METDEISVKVQDRKLEFAEKTVIFLQFNLKRELTMETIKIQINVFQIFITVDFADQILQRTKVLASVILKIVPGHFSHQKYG